MRSWGASGDAEAADPIRRVPVDHVFVGEQLMDDDTLYPHCTITTLEIYYRYIIDTMPCSSKSTSSMLDHISLYISMFMYPIILRCLMDFTSSIGTLNP